MSRRLNPLPVLEGDQQLASDPSAHAALSASAGTGKTQVLTARVLRLLLQGTPPQAILCLTFTKAGAAEMANRLGERLARWVRMDEAALRHDLFALGEERDPPALQRARRLFARVIEAPGGLRIQTIHAFAQTLLASFPAEAGIVPGFQPIEGRAEAELARKTLAALLVEAEEGGDRGLIADVQSLSLRLGEQGAVTYLMDCARADPAAIEPFAVPGAAETWLHREMKLPDGKSNQGRVLPQRPLRRRRLRLRPVARHRRRQPVVGRQDRGRPCRDDRALAGDGPRRPRRGAARPGAGRVHPVGRPAEGLPRANQGRCRLSSAR